MTLPDPYSVLTAPGGRGRLARAGDALVGEDGRRFPIERGIVRMLDAVDPLLAAELAAQAEALPLYTDERLLMTRLEREVARVAVEELLDGVRGTILDAGCGIGLCGRLYPELGLFGADASVTLLEQARSGYQLRVECTVEELPFADASFDAVLALNMLHHVIHPEAAVAELARLLKPGGVLVSVDPRKVAPIELAKRLLRGRDPAYAPTHRSFSTGEYAELLCAGGALRVETVRPIGLVSLLTAGGLDAIGLSRKLTLPQQALDLLLALDRTLTELPHLSKAGLNLFTRARRP